MKLSFWLTWFALLVRILLHFLAFHVACVIGEKWNFIFSQGYPTGQICAWAFKEQNLSTYTLTEKIWLLLLEFR